MSLHDLMLSRESLTDPIEPFLRLFTAYMTRLLPAISDTFYA